MQSRTDNVYNNISSGKRKVFGIAFDAYTYLSEISV